MDFATAALFGSLLSKDYAEDMLKLLVNYQDISASESASRLNLHIRTAQDFLDKLADLGILQKQEVYEKKRPYYRYTLTTYEINIRIDLNEIAKPQSENALQTIIREQQDSGARFSTARNADAINQVVIWTGDGRERKERRINLTNPQGKFLFHLPFPSAQPLAIAEIMQKAAIAPDLAPEILDIVALLTRYHVIESVPTPSLGSE